jgi:DNA repair ATPase RecN
LSDIPLKVLTEKVHALERKQDVIERKLDAIENRLKATEGHQKKYAILLDSYQQLLEKLTRRSEIGS